MKKRLFKLLSLAMAAVILLSVALPTVSATSGNIDPDIIAETSQTAVELESEGIVLLKMRITSSRSRVKDKYLRRRLRLPLPRRRRLRRNNDRRPRYLL